MAVSVAVLSGQFPSFEKKIKAIGAQISQRPTVSTATGPFQYKVLGVVMVLAAVEGEKRRTMKI